jgi:hypothetical protein
MMQAMNESLPIGERRRHSPETSKQPPRPSSVVGAINDVGLVAEEVGSRDGEMIGNFPQAFSHIGLINAAWAITQAQHRTGRA